MVWVGLYLGLRPGEVRALGVSDIDLVEGTVTINHQLDSYRRITEPETKGSRRSLRVGNVLWEH